MIKNVVNSPTFTTWLNFLSRSLSLFILNPLIFKFLDTDGVFNWFFINTVFSFILIFDFGLLPNTTRILSRKLSKFNYDINKVKSILEDIKLLYSCLSAFVLIFGSFFISILFYIFLVGETSINKILLGLFISSIATISIFNNYYISTIQSFLKVAEVQLTLAFVNFIIIILTALIIYFTDSIVFSVIIFYLSHLFIFILIRIKHKNIIHVKVHLKLTSLKISKSKLYKSEIFNSSFKSGLGMFFSTGLILGSNFFVSYFFDTSKASLYMFYNQIIRSVSGFSQAPFYSSLPKMNSIFGLNKIDKFKSYIISRFRISIYLYLFSAFLISYFLPLIFIFFKIDKAFLINDLWILLFITFYFERVSGMIVQTLTISKEIIWHWLNLLNGIFTITICFILFSSFSILALPISLSITFLLINIPISQYKLINRVKINFYKEIFKSFLVLILFSLILINFN